MGFTTGRKRACWSSLSRAGSQKQHSTLSFHCPTEAQPPGRTGKDWLDGGMNGWIDTKESEGLVNKHLRADTLPAGMESDSETEKKASDETERKYRWGNSFSITRAKIYQNSLQNKQTDRGREIERNEDKEEEEGMLGQRQSVPEDCSSHRHKNTRAPRMTVSSCNRQAHSVEAHLGFSWQDATLSNLKQRCNYQAYAGIFRIDYIPHIVKYINIYVKPLKKCQYPRHSTLY